jgi:uncharacterized iron-regulated membrane protein
MKVFFRTIHLYLGLSVGLVVMITCFTGSILVFEKELQEVFNHERYYVQPKGPRIPLEEIIRSLKTNYPGAKITGIKVYSDSKRSIEVGLIRPEKDKGKAERTEAKQKRPENKNQLPGNKKDEKSDTAPGHATRTAFIDPYTGKVLDLYVYRETFFYKVFALHRWLLGSNNGVGKYIVGVATFLFMFILLTGVILWWPKTKRILFNRLKIKADSGWKRLNHDMHIVFGFYSAVFLFIFAFTAMSWSFSWFNKGIYTITNSTAENPQPPQSIYEGSKRKVTIDQGFSWAKSNFRNSESFNIRAPKDSIGIYSITALASGASDSQSDVYYMDQYSGVIIGSLKFADKNPGQQIRAQIKPLHTGSIFGLPGKIIAFITCLLGFTFPITGVIMWLNRLKKGNKTLMVE